MRLPRIAPAGLTTAQRPLYDDMRAGVAAKYDLFTTARADGALLGPWNAWLHRTFGMAAVWAEMAGDLKAVPIERCGHLPHEERPDEVNRVLLDFLAGWHG